MSYCSSNIAERPSLTKKCKESLWDQTSNIIAINNKYFVKHDTKFEAWRWDDDSTNEEKNIVFNEMSNNKSVCVRAAHARMCSVTMNVRHGDVWGSIQSRKWYYWEEI